MGIYADGDYQSLLNTANGGPGSVLRFNGINDPSLYATTIQNQNATGLHLNVPGILQATNAGVTIPVLAVTTLAATTANVGTLNVSGNTALGDGAGDTTTISGPATVGGTLGVTGTSTLGVLNAGATTVTDLTATGNVALGNANTDTLTVIGVSTFRNAANTLTQLLVDAGNNRVIVGSATALGSDTTPALHVVGRAYIAPDSANDLALQIRRSSAATVGWSLGVESTNDFIFKDDAGTSIVRVGDIASTYQLDVVAGDFHVADDAVIAGDVSSSRAVVGDTTFSGTEELRVVGQTRLEGALTVTTGGVSVTGASTFANSITVSSGGIGVTGSSTFNSGLSISGGLSVLTGNVNFPNTTTGFFGQAGTTFQAVTGSRGGNAALASLLTALDNLGLINDLSS